MLCASPQLDTRTFCTSRPLYKGLFPFLLPPRCGKPKLFGSWPWCDPGVGTGAPKIPQPRSPVWSCSIPSLQGAAGEGGAGEGAREGFLPGWALSEPGSKPFFFWLRERPGAEVLPCTPKFASGDELGGTRSCWVLGPQMKHPGRNGRRSFHQPRVCTRTLLVPARGAAGEVDVLNALPCPPQPPRRGSTSSLAACHFSADV